MPWMQLFGSSCDLEKWKLFLLCFKQALKTGAELSKELVVLQTEVKEERGSLKI